jgi:hypothetical protein
MVKKYSSPAARFTINVKKDGKSYAIDFDNYDPEEKRRWIEISEPEIQKQMEASADFNVYFKCDGVTKWDSPEAVMAPIPLINPEVKKSDEIIEKKDLMEAKRWLNSIGVPYNKMKNKDVVVSIAKDQGYILNFETDKK